MVARWIATRLARIRYLDGTVEFSDMQKQSSEITPLGKTCTVHRYWLAPSVDSVAGWSAGHVTTRGYVIISTSLVVFGEQARFSRVVKLVSHVLQKI